MTATFKHDLSSDTWTFEDPFRACRFFLSAHLKLGATIQGRKNAPGMYSARREEKYVQNFTWRKTRKNFGVHLSETLPRCGLD